MRIHCTIQSDAKEQMMCGVLVQKRKGIRENLWSASLLGDLSLKKLRRSIHCHEMGLRTSWGINDRNSQSILSPWQETP
jgi:hypothetical protein